MGLQQSVLSATSSSTETANDLWRKESAIKGLQAASAFGAAVLFAPAVMLALPLVGAYEFGTALEEELLTGHCVFDGILGGLFGVVASPLAPFYCFLVSIQKIFELNYTKRSNHPRQLDTNYMKRAEGMLRLDFSCYNVAITGCPGTGKSSLLNSMMGYKDHHQKAAAIGEIETTLEPKCYRHPVLHTLYLWDMPGVGTPRHPLKGFFENYCLGAFDAILIVFDDRLMASDIEIARRARHYDVPVFFVKTKADLSLDRMMSRMKSDIPDTQKWAMATSQLTVQIKETIYKNMKQFGLDTNQLYIVSAHVLRDFVILLRDRKPIVSQQKLIHEKVLITNILDTLAEEKEKQTCNTLNNGTAVAKNRSDTLRKKLGNKSLIYL